MPFLLAGINFLYFTFYELAIFIIYDPAEWQNGIHALDPVQVKVEEEEDQLAVFEVNVCFLLQSFFSQETSFVVRGGEWAMDNLHISY